jgi:hypothetical protein
MLLHRNLENGQVFLRMSRMHKTRLEHLEHGETTPREIVERRRPLVRLHRPNFLIGEW